MNQALPPINTNKKYRRYYTYIEPVIADPVIKGYFTLIASLLLCAFFIVFALSPTFSTIVGLTRKIDDQKKLIGTMDGKISDLIMAQETFTQIKPLLPLLNTAFPLKPSPESIINGSVQAASAAGVSVEMFQIGPTYLAGISPPTTEEESPTVADVTKSTKSPLISTLGIPLVEFSTTVRGDEVSIRKFVGRVQYLPRVISVATISIGADDQIDHPDPKKLIGNVVGIAYYQHQNKATIKAAITEPVVK